jgi:hypothetical protein
MVDYDLLKKIEQKVSLAESFDLNFSNPDINIQGDPSLQAAFRTLHQVSLPLDEVINKTIEKERIFPSAAAKVSHELRTYGVNLRSGFQFPNLFSWVLSPFNIPTNFCCFFWLLLQPIYFIAYEPWAQHFCFSNALRWLRRKHHR